MGLLLGVAKRTLGFVVDPIVVAPDLIDVPSFDRAVFLEHNVGVCVTRHREAITANGEVGVAFGFV